MEEFVKPADLFKKRRTSYVTPMTIHDNRSCPSFSSFMSARKKVPSSVAQSPMKCLNNLTDPSPTKKLPTLIRNPFNQPVKRRLQLGSSPMKRSSENTTDSSPLKSPVKKSSRIFEMNDEDANLEPPKMKHQLRNSPVKKLTNSSIACFQNNWTLRTKLRINFQSGCKNWSQSSTTTHKRHSGNLMDEDTPSKVNDKTISLEAIKNAATVYQHPYLPWLPLFPRIVFDKATMVTNDPEKKQAQLAISKHPAATKAMHKAWCESIDDLTNLLIDGKCPYFYLCSDTKTMLFRRPSGGDDAQAFITPFSFDFGLSLSKIGIDYKQDVMIDLENNIENTNTNTNSCNSQISGGLNNNNTSSQSNFSANLVRSCPTAAVELESDDEELDVKDEEDNETSQAWLDSIGVKDLVDDVRPSSRSQDRGSKLGSRDKLIGVIEGAENIRKLIQLLQTTKTYTTTAGGEFASIPPTLISPREFRLSTPQYPEVNVIMGLRSVELQGVILPSVYRKLHKLLIVSDNADHSCSARQLESSMPFGKLRFPSLN